MIRKQYVISFSYREKDTSTVHFDCLATIIPVNEFKSIPSIIYSYLVEEENVHPSELTITGIWSE